MAIWQAWGNGEPWDGITVQTLCFFCGRPVGERAVFWHGVTGLVVLHPACCIDLSLRLSHDVFHLVRQNHEKVQLGGRE